MLRFPKWILMDSRVMTLRDALFFFGIRFLISDEPLILQAKLTGNKFFTQFY